MKLKHPSIKTNMPKMRFETVITILNVRNQSVATKE